MAAQTHDKRALRSRQALLSAFFGLVLERRYDEIKVDDVVARAGVSRSTFYEHFKGKDDLLALSIRYPFASLANAVRRADNVAELTMVLQHFWENRAIARGIFSGAVRRKTIAVLIELVDERLRAEADAMPNSLIIPRKLVAIQLAESLLAPTTAWLAGESECSAEALAVALRRIVAASIASVSRRA